MAPQSLFEKAAAYVATPACDGATNDQKLQLYGLFKQATKGDAVGPRPGMFEAVKRAKYDAWAKETGLPPDEARRRYVRLVCEILPAFTTVPPLPGGAPTATATTATIAAAAASTTSSPSANTLSDQSSRIQSDASCRNEATITAAAVDSPAAFEAAVSHAATPACSDATNDQKLQLYGLFKQAKKGNASSWDRPGMFDPVGRAKYDAWAKLDGMGPVSARAAYVKLVQKLDPQFSPNASAAAATSTATSTTSSANGSSAAEAPDFAPPFARKGTSSATTTTSTPLRPRARPAPRAQSVKGLEIVRYSQAGFASASKSMDAILAAHGVRPENQSGISSSSSQSNNSQSNSSGSSSGSRGSSGGARSSMQHESSAGPLSNQTTQQALLDSEVDWYGLPFEGGDSLSSVIQGRNIAEQSSRSPNASPSRSRNRRRGGSRTNDDGDNDDDDNGSNSSSSSSSSSSREAWPGFVALIVAMDQWLWAAWADGGTTVALVALAVMAAGAIVQEHYSTAAAAVFASVYVALSVQSSSGSNDGRITNAEGTAAIGHSKNDNTPTAAAGNGSGLRNADASQQNSNRSSSSSSHSTHGSVSASVGGSGGGDVGEDAAGGERAFKPLKRRRSSNQRRGNSFNGSTHGHRGGGGPPLPSSSLPPLPPSPLRDSTTTTPTKVQPDAAAEAGREGGALRSEATSVTPVATTAACDNSAEVNSRDSHDIHRHHSSRSSSNDSGGAPNAISSSGLTTANDDDDDEGDVEVVDAVESLRAFTGKWRKDLAKSDDQSAHMKAIGVPWIVRAAIARSPQVTEIETDGRTWIETTVNVGGRKVQTLQLDNSLQERRNPLDKTPVTMASALRADGAVVTESEYPALGLTQTLTRMVSGVQQEVYTVTNIMRLADGTELIAKSHFDRLSDDDDDDENRAHSANDDADMSNSSAVKEY